LCSAPLAANSKISGNIPISNANPADKKAAPIAIGTPKRIL